MQKQRVLQRSQSWMEIQVRLRKQVPLDCIMVLLQQLVKKQQRPQLANQIPRTKILHPMHNQKNFTRPSEGVLPNIFSATSIRNTLIESKSGYENNMFLPKCSITPKINRVRSGSYAIGSRFVFIRVRA